MIAQFPSGERALAGSVNNVYITPGVAQKCANDPIRPAESGLYGIFATTSRCLLLHIVFFEDEPELFVISPDG